MTAENKPFPYEIKDIEPDLNVEMMKYFTGQHTGFVYVGPKKYFMPEEYKREASRIYNMEIRPSDIVVATYPRSGTTWTQELVWMVANDLDYAGSEATPLTDRYPFLEFSTLVHPVMRNRFLEENNDSEENMKLVKFVTGSAVEQLAQRPSPRFIKTHLPFSMLPPNLLDTAKVVYVARDPRDVAVSFYHLNRLIRVLGYIGDFKKYWSYFMKDLQYCSPFFEHIKEAWQKRHHPNLLFLFYEDLAKDLPSAVQRVSTFLGKQYTDEQIARLCEHLSIESFKKNKSINYDVMSKLGILLPGEQTFIRKGKAGSWRDYFDDEMTQQAERWIADNLRDTDLRFPHMQNI